MANITNQRDDTRIKKKSVMNGRRERNEVGYRGAARYPKSLPKQVLKRRTTNCLIETKKQKG